MGKAGRGKSDKKRGGLAPGGSGPALSRHDLKRVEFHRHGLALFPDHADRRPGIAMLVEGNRTRLKQRFCSCTVSGSRTCRHIRKLIQIRKNLTAMLAGKTPEEDFRSSPWHAFAEIIADGSVERPDTVRVGTAGSGDREVIRIFASTGEEMLSYRKKAPGSSRFLERCVAVGGEDDSVPRRAEILSRLGLMTLTENERMMGERGFKTRRQAMEESFWYRAAYHGYREFGHEGCTFHPTIEETSGKFTVSVAGRDGEDLFRMVIPRPRVKRLLAAFSDLLPNQHQLAIHPIPLKSIFMVSRDTELDMEVRPMIELIQENGESRFFEREDLKRFQYGELIYIREMGILAELEPDGRGSPVFRGICRRRPEFLAPGGQRAQTPQVHKAL
ncbi:MAG: hypothetical protein JRF51_18315 [Deltaproteobacteria bacterium]|nr:hypothetical protein [Deltaproteobacteria bacterium]